MEVFGGVPQLGLGQEEFQVPPGRPPPNEIPTDFILLGYKFRTYNKSQIFDSWIYAREDDESKAPWRKEDEGTMRKLDARGGIKWWTLDHEPMLGVGPDPNLDDRRKRRAKDETNPKSGKNRRTSSGSGGAVVGGADDANGDRGGVAAAPGLGAAVARNSEHLFFPTPNLVNPAAAAAAAAAPSQPMNASEYRKHLEEKLSQLPDLAVLKGSQAYGSLLSFVAKEHETSMSISNGQATELRDCQLELKYMRAQYDCDDPETMLLRVAKGVEWLRLLGTNVLHRLDGDYGERRHFKDLTAKDQDESKACDVIKHNLLRYRLKEGTHYTYNRQNQGDGARRRPDFSMAVGTHTHTSSTTVTWQYDTSPSQPCDELGVFVEVKYWRLDSRCNPPRLEKKTGEEDRLHGQIIADFEEAVNFGERQFHAGLILILVPASTNSHDMNWLYDRLRPKTLLIQAAVRASSPKNQNANVGLSVARIGPNESGEATPKFVSSMAPKHKPPS